MPRLLFAVLNRTATQTETVTWWTTLTADPSFVHFNLSSMEHRLIASGTLTNYRTTTRTLTSTAWIDNSGNTIFFAKRGLPVTNSVATRSILPLKKVSKVTPVITAVAAPILRCNNLIQVESPIPTITRIATVSLSSGESLLHNLFRLDLPACLLIRAHNLCQICCIWTCSVRNDY